MKTKFSTKWKRSEKAAKQRSYRCRAPLHIRHKFMSANLSKELREKYGRRSLPIRKGDIVRIMKGEFKKKKGKIISIDTKKGKVFVEGIQRLKKDGTKTNVPLSPHVLQITELLLEDKKRVKVLQRKNLQEKKEKISEEKKS